MQLPLNYVQECRLVRYQITSLYILAAVIVKAYKFPPGFLRRAALGFGLGFSMNSFLTSS